MESLFIIGSIALALMLGAISPGPTFIYVAKIQLRFHVSMACLLHWAQGLAQHYSVFLPSWGYKPYCWLCLRPILF